MKPNFGPRAAMRDAETLLNAVAELPDATASFGRLIEELIDSIERQRAGLARTEATLAAVIEAVTTP